jgi:hypothetical protein
MKIYMYKWIMIIFSIVFSCVFIYGMYDKYNEFTPETRSKNNKSQIQSANKYCESMHLNCEVISCPFATKCGFCDIKYGEAKLASLDCCDNFCQLRSIKQ